MRPRSRCRRNEEKTDPRVLAPRGGWQSPLRSAEPGWGPACAARRERQQTPYCFSVQLFEQETGLKNVFFLKKSTAFLQSVLIPNFCTQGSTLLCSTLLYSALLYPTLHCSTLLYSALLYFTLLYSTLPYSTLLYFALLYSALLCSTLP